MTGPGMWSKFSSNVDDAVYSIFREALHDLVGVNYEPVAYATQVVKGTNYSFFCNALGVYPGAINQPAMVDIYQEPGKSPVITRIRILEY